MNLMCVHPTGQGVAEVAGPRGAHAARGDDAFDRVLQLGHQCAGDVGRVAEGRGGDAEHGGRQRPT